MSWSWHKHPITSLSSTEAEYIALASAARETVWLRRFLCEIGHPQTGPTEILVDNQSAIKLSLNPEFHKRTKHIQVRYHFTRELVEQKSLVVKYVPTEQLADCLTKPLQKTKHSTIVKKLGLGRDRETEEKPEESPPAAAKKKVERPAVGA